MKDSFLQDISFITSKYFSPSDADLSSEMMRLSARVRSSRWRNAPLVSDSRPEFLRSRPKSRVARVADKFPHAAFSSSAASICF